MTRLKKIKALAPIGILALLIIIISSPGAIATDSEGYVPGKLVERTLSAVGRHYLDPSQINTQDMLDKALDAIQKLVPDVIVRDRTSGQLSVTAGLATKRIRMKSTYRLSELSSALGEVLDFIVKHYESADQIKPEEIEYAAIEGMLETLDPHSNFLTPKIYKEFRVGTTGKFGGLGIVISIKDGMLTVISPLEGTPASSAGISAGDRIMQIGDESTINMSLTDAVNKLRGDVGTKVTIVVERTGQPPRKITIKRAVINIDSVQHSLLAEDGKRIGYIKLKNFQDNTDDDVLTAMSEFHKDGAKLDGLILDLRNNPGGLLNISSEIADLFLSKGIIVSTVGQRGRVIDKTSASERGTEPDYPIVVLINEGSASASEIVAGALGQNDRALIAGRRSFGKGSVQTIFNLGDDAALKLTIAEYKPAGTESIQLVGITPDIELVPSTVDADAMNVVKDKLPTEHELELQFDRKKIRESKRKEAESLFRLSYLKPKEDKKDLEERSRKEYLKKPDVSGDFPVEFARRLIAQTGSPSRKEMLKRSEAIVKQMQAEQQGSIDTELKELGINWSKAKPKGSPRLDLSYRLTKDGKRISKARAGDKVRLELTATNRGTGPYSRLIGVGESESDLLEGREFPFGRIEPGQSRSFSSPLELPESLPRQDLTMELGFTEANGITPEPVTVVVPIEGTPHPAFGFKMSLPAQAKGKPFPTNGRSIPLIVDVTNIGQGGSGTETVATLSNECGEKFFIQKGRVKLGAMPSKGSKRAQFSFRINGKPDEECAVKLTVIDLKLLKVLVKNVELNIADGTLKPEAGKLYSEPIIAVNDYPTTTSKSTVIITGTVKDKDPIRDFYLFVGDKKIAYIPNTEGVTSMPFKVAIPLEEGQNRIAIGARDIEDIANMRYLVIEKVKAGPVAGADSASHIPNFTP